MQTDATVTQVAGDTESSEQLLTEAEKSDIKDHPEDFLNPDETYTSFSGDEADQIAENSNDEESASSRFPETTISNSQSNTDDEASYVARHIKLYKCLALWCTKMMTSFWSTRLFDWGKLQFVNMVMISGKQDPLWPFE